MMNAHILDMTRKLSLSYEIALSIGGSLDLGEMMKRFLKTVVRKGEAYRGLVWLLDGEEPTLVSAVGSFSRGMDYDTIARQLKESIANRLKAGTPLLKTVDDEDFLHFCLPFTGNEKEVLLVPIGQQTVLQLFFTYPGASQGLARVLEGLIPKLTTSIAACQNYYKLLDLEKKEKNSLQIKYFDLMNNLDVGIFICDLNGYFIDANHAFLGLLGVKSIEELQQLPFGSIFESCHNGLMEVLQREGRIKNLEVRIKQKNSNSFWANLTAVFRSLDHGYYILGILDDIDERKKIEKKLQYLATYDSLTNVPNRYSLEEALQLTVEKAKEGHQSALLLMDLDNFKLVNDTLGHTAGDEVLVQFARILKKNIRDWDFLARIGGDEFAVIIEDIGQDEVLQLADRIRKAVYENEVIIADSTKLNLSISIGIVLINGALDYQKILSKADTALYKAKEEGRNKVAFLDYQDDDSLEFIKINRRIKEIKQALREERLILQYQPIVSLREGQILHYEALVRLQDENNELLYPDEFIPVAERFGLMVEIDHWVVKAALRKLVEFPNIKVFVNLSAVTLLNSQLLLNIEKDIIHSGIDPSRLGFEITETSAMKDLAVTERWLRRLKEIGCQFALDDFGTGFSSFSYLMNLSVDYIKIDGSFVKNINDNPAHFTLVYAMTKVAHAFGKQTIAEYVENEDIANTLRELKITCGQGYYFGKPAEILEFD